MSIDVEDEQEVLENEMGRELTEQELIDLASDWFDLAIA